MKDPKCTQESDSKGYSVRTCCWNDAGGPPALRNFVCQKCRLDSSGGWTVCEPKKPQSLEQPPTSQTSGPAAPLQDGVLEQPPTQGVAPPLTQGQGVLPQDGVLEEPQTGEGAIQSQPAIPTQPAIVDDEPVPTCPEGQVLDEESRLCVVEEPEEQESEEPEEPEETQPEENGPDENGDN